MTSCCFIYGVLPSVLHDDPRYFRRVVIQSAAGSGMPLRARDYAEGFGAAETFNVRQPLVQLTQQGISISSYPAQDRTGPSVFTQWGVNFAYNGR